MYEAVQVTLLACPSRYSGGVGVIVRDEKEPGTQMVNINILVSVKEKTVSFLNIYRIHFAFKILEVLAR